MLDCSSGVSFYRPNFGLLVSLEEWKKSKDRDKSDTNNVAANVDAARVWLAELVTLGALVLIFWYQC